MKLLFSIAALAVTWSAPAQGTLEAVLGYTNNFSAYVNTTVGWTFQATRTFTVTELGCFDKVFNDNPTVTSIQVGLWDNSGSLLASNVVTAGSGLFNLTRYESVTPVALAPGQSYHLGVYYPDGFISLDVAGAMAGGTVSTSADVQLSATAQAGGGFAFPVEQAGTEGSIYAGPNFQFLSQPALIIQRWPSNQVRLSWLAAFPGFTLQSELGLSHSWTNSGLSVTTVGNQFVVFDTIGPISKYYRLSK